ncbi:hypothetical protein IKO_05739, partial [Bacillus cereus VDM034]
MNYTSPTIKQVSSKGSADCACGLLI